MGRRALLAEGTAKAKAQRRERPWHSPRVEGRPLHVLSKGESRAGGRMWNMQGFEAGQGAGVSSKRDGRLPRILCRSRTGGDFPLNGVPGSSVEIGSERGKREKQGGNQGATATSLTSAPPGIFDSMRPALGGFLCVPAFLPHSSNSTSIKNQLQGIVNNLFTCLSP